MALLSATIVFILLASSSNCRSFEAPISKFHDNNGEFTHTETTTVLTYSTVPENDAFIFEDAIPGNADGTTILQTTTISTLNIDLTNNQLNGVNSDIQHDANILEPTAWTDETGAIANNDNKQFVSGKGSGAKHVISEGSNIIWNIGADSNSNQASATVDNDNNQFVSDEGLSANHDISDGSNIKELIGPIARKTAHIFIQMIRLLLEFFKPDQTN